MHKHTNELVQDQYGNYVIQHIIERGHASDRGAIIDKIRGNLLTLSKHKFASNVVEKCITFGSASEKTDLMNEALTPKADGYFLSSLCQDEREGMIH